MKQSSLVNMESDLKRWYHQTIRMDVLAWIASIVAFLQLTIIASAFGTTPGTLSDTILLAIGPVVYLFRKALGMLRRKATREQLSLDLEFMTLASDPEQVALALEPQSRFWMRSVLVQGVRSTGFRPDLDTEAGPDLKWQLTQVYTTLWGRIAPSGGWIDSAILVVWALLLILSSDSPALSGGQSPWSAVTWILAAWLALAFLVVCETLYARFAVEARQIVRQLPGKSMLWMSNRLETAAARVHVKPYRRREQVRRLPWRGG